MNICIQWRQIVWLALFFLLPLKAVLGAPAIMTVDEIKPGMRGIGKTVIAGQQIEEFGVEILGIMKDKGPVGDLILVRTYGDLIEKTGGIAQGMSGSPVYVEGKLIGAIGYGWALTDHKLGMVTPINDMLRLLELPQIPAKQQTNWIVMPDEEQTKLEPVATPLMVSGFTERALQLLGEQLKPYSLVPYAVGSAATINAGAAIEPGSAIGVQLVQGDVSMGALGTVTYVDGDKVLALGHPFLKKGPVDYYLANAYIFTTIQSLENSFKLGVTGESIGKVTQDRSAGIAGNLDKFPSNIPVRVQVYDETNGYNRSAFFRAVQDEQIGPTLAALGVFNLIDKTSDRVGPGTATVEFTITAKDMPGDVLTRTNMVYSPVGASEAAVGELHEALTILAANRYQAIDITDVFVKVSLTDERRTAAIMKAVPRQSKVRPGDSVVIDVRLKPYRGEPIIKSLLYTVPSDSPAGMTQLTVRGGSMVPLAKLLKKEGLELMPVRNWDKSFEQILLEFGARDRNNDLVVERVALGNSASNPVPNKPADAAATLTPEPKPIPKVNESQSKLAVESPVKPPLPNKDKVALATDYIIEGDTSISLEIYQ